MSIRGWTWAVIGGAVVLVVLGMMVSLLAPRREATVYSAGSPEALVADYIRLRREGRISEAERLLAEGYSADPYSDYVWGNEPARMVLTGAEYRGEDASVVVQVSRVEPGSLLPSESAQRVRFSLRRVSGSWVIVGMDPYYQ